MKAKISILTVSLFVFGAFLLPITAQESGNQLTISIATTEAFGGGGGGGCDGCGGDDPGGGGPDDPGPVECTLSASATTIDIYDVSTLTWTTKNAASVTLLRPEPHNLQTVGNNGSRDVSPRSTFTFVLTANGGFDKAVCMVTITVKTPPPADPVCDISANPTSVVKGNSSTLTWSSQNAVTANLKGFGSVALNGHRAVTPDATTKYVLSVTNSAGVTKYCNATVTVTVPTPLPVCTLTANPTKINKGDSSTLTWTTDNAHTVTLKRATGTNAVALDGSVQVTPSITYTFVLTATGDGGTVTCSKTVTVTPPVISKPTCELNANPLKINQGDSSTLTWKTTNATTVTIDRPAGLKTVDASGSLDVYPWKTYTFVLTATGDGGTVTCSKTVTVNPVVVPAPVCDISANPSSITAGDSSKLKWTSQNAVTAYINQGIGSVALNGNRNVHPGVTTTYTLTVKNSAGVEKTCATTITVTKVPTSPVCESFSASPRVIERGERSTLSWTTKNAISVAISHGIGSVSKNGSINVSPTRTTTYELTVYGNKGSEVSCHTTVIVEDDEAFTCENNVDFYASPRYIDEGEETTLYWNTNGVTSLYFNRISSTRLDGSEEVSPDSDTTYIMYASNGSRTISCSVTVEVDEDNGGGGGGSTRPTCDLNASDTRVNRGDAVRLSWDTRNAYDVVLEDNYGRTYIDSNGQRSSIVDDLLDDSITVYPTRDTTYTLTAERGSYDRECSVKIYVEDDDIIVNEIRDQKPIVTGISLLEVPYTGFEAGPFMTVAFYMLLVLWALYLAYVLVIRRTPAFASIATDTPTNSDIGQYTQSPSFVTTTATPNFHVPAAAPVAPTGVQYGYGGVVNDEAATEVENRAHAAHVLFSGEAMRYFMETTNPNNRMSALDKVLDEAKASYPAEDGWVVLNEERLAQTCAVCFAQKSATPTPSFTPATGAVGNSSLAEAIVTGNIVAAYQMIGNRPMIALADTAADLDALYRAKQGADVTVSKLLAHSDVKTEQLHNAIAALTGALDGTYTDEAEAVKMAIMKAVKAIHG